MGSFANSAFSVLLGWIRSAVLWLWNLLTSQESGGLVSWVTANWKALVFILCVGGMVIDVVVYILRWRPYRVWASFFRRLRGKGAEEEEQPIHRSPRRRRPAPPATAQSVPLQPALHREWIYPDGTARTEDILQPMPEEVPPETAYEPEAYIPWSDAAVAQAKQQPDIASVLSSRAASTELSRRYVMKFARPQAQQEEAPIDDMWHVPTDPVQLQYQQMPEIRMPSQVQGLEDYPQPASPVIAPEPDPEPEVEAPEAEEQQPEPIVRRPLYKALKVTLPKTFGLTNDEDELDLRYKPAPPAVDKKQAYRAPVIPPQWKPPSEIGGNEPQEESSRWN